MAIIPAKIIDFHVHLFPDKLFEAIWDSFVRNYNWNIIHRYYYKECIARLRQGGVDIIVYSNYAHRAGIAEGLNRWNGLGVPLAAWASVLAAALVLVLPPAVKLSRALDALVLGEASAASLGLPLPENGAEWLGLMGLRFFPVATTNRNELLTTGCAKAWKSGGHLTWPLWTGALTAAEIAPLLSENHEHLASTERHARGDDRLLRAPIGPPAGCAPEPGGSPAGLGGPSGRPLHGLRGP